MRKKKIVRVFSPKGKNTEKRFENLKNHVDSLYEKKNYAEILHVLREYATKSAKNKLKDYEDSFIGALGVGMYFVDPDAINGANLKKTFDSLSAKDFSLDFSEKKKKKKS